MASSTPSAILSDAITSLSHAATLALATVEDQARLDVARATSETRQARNQRDEALNALRAAELGQSNHKQQLEGWKTAVEKADLTIKHQTETISQLRDETSHWKDQYARLEKTCQQWKDQFLRVEQERYRLSARLEELVSDQLTYANSPAQQYYLAPNSKPPNQELVEFATASTSTKRASTSSDQNAFKHKLVDDGVTLSNTKSHKPHKIAISSGTHKNLPSTPTSTSADKPSKKSVTARTIHDNSTKKQHNSVPATSSKAQVQVDPSSASHRSRTQVIRRVQAVIEVPIKMEDEEKLQYPQPDPDQEEPEVPRPAKKSRITKPITSPKKKTATNNQPKDRERQKSKSWQVWRDEEYRTPLTNDEGDDDDDSYEPTRRRNPRGKKTLRDLREPESGDGEDDEDEADEDEDEDEDELIMGVDDNQEVYGTRSFPPEKLKSKSAKSAPSHRTRATQSRPTVISQKQLVNPKKRKAAPNVSDDDGRAECDARVTKRK